MIPLAKETVAAYSKRLEADGVPNQERSSFLRWVRFYLDFCHTYQQPARDLESIVPFLAKLESKGQSTHETEQAKRAIELLLRRGGASGPAGATQSRGFAPDLSVERLGADASKVFVASPVGRDAAWLKAHRDLEGAIRMRNYSPKTL